MKIKRQVGKVKTWLRQDRRRSTMLLFILIFAVLGTIALIVSRAATPSASIEAENGALSGSATKISDSAASKGSAIQFGNGGGGNLTINNGFRLGIATGYPYVQDKDHPDKFSITYKSYVDKVASLGVSWIRTDAIVNGTQPITVLDQTMTEAKAKNIKLLVTWMYGDMNNPSATLSKMTDFYNHWKSLGLDSTIGAYEMGNEINNPDPRFGVQDPAKIAAWMKLSYPTLKRWSPNAPIMPGGFAPVGGNVPAGSSNISNPADYLTALYSHNGNSSRNMFDAVANHPYANNTSSNYPEGNTSQSGLRVTYYLRQVMNRFGDQSKQIWGTEGGWSSCGTNQWSEEQRSIRMLNDLNDWFYGVHDSSGKRTGYAASADWNTGPYMVFKLYKAGTGGTDDDNGIIYTDVMKCGGKPANYEPPVIGGIKLYSGTNIGNIPSRIAQ